MTIKQYIFTTLLIILNVSLYAQNALTISPIGPQVTVAGSSMPIFFSGVNGLPSGIIYISSNKPDFVSLEIDGENAGRFIVNAKNEDIGIYDFNLIATYNGLSTIQSIHLEVLEVQGISYYCDPINGSIANSGDKDNPWSTLQAVFEAHKTFEAGDVIYLYDGDHGTPQIKGINEQDVYIVAAADHRPGLRSVKLNSTKHWVLSGLVISPEVAATTAKGSYVELDYNAGYNTIQNCEIYGIKNSAGWSTNQDWYDNCGDGITSYGKHTLMINNYLYNTYFTVQVLGEYSEFNFNTIDRYGGDAIRGLADHTSYNHNVIKNPVVDDYATGNHDDAFQSWTTAFGPSKKDIKIIGNQVFSSTHTEIPLLSSVLQGIINFDGFSEDWVIANNLVVVDHPHGITLVGAKNCKIVNNTVIKNPLNIFHLGIPWIGIWYTKPTAGNKPSTGNLIRNNIMASYSDATPEVTQGNHPSGTKDHNRISIDYNSIFRGYKTWDFRLKDNPVTINSGTIDEATYIDIEGFRRDIGAIDLGCYESGANLLDIVVPTDVTNIIATEITPGSIALDWDDSNDENGIAYYEIIEASGTTYTTKNSEAILSGLFRNTSYKYQIWAYDYFGNKSTMPGFISVMTAQNEGMEEVFVIPANRYDQEVESEGVLRWVGTKHMKAGGNFVVSLLPFKLPWLKTGKKIINGSLTLYVDKINNNPTDINLYGTGSRKHAEVLSSDYSTGPIDTDPVGTLLQASYLNATTNVGKQESNEMLNTNITKYVQTTYDAGAKINDHIFFRLNSNGGGDEEDYFSINSADADDIYKRPLLKLIVDDISGVQKSRIKEGIYIFPSPASTAEQLSLSLQGFDPGEQVKIYVHDTKGQLIKSFYHQVTVNNNRFRIPVIPTKTGYLLFTIIGAHSYRETTVLIID